MKKYKVVMSEIAKKDIVDIYNYIALDCDNKLGATKVIRIITTKYNKLSIHPKIATVTLKRKNEELRFIRAGKYTIIYYIKRSEPTIVIHRIVNSKRNFITELMKNN